MIEEIIHSYLGKKKMFSSFLSLASVLPLDVHSESHPGSQSPQKKLLVNPELWHHMEICIKPMHRLWQTSAPSAPVMSVARYLSTVRPPKRVSPSVN